MQAKFWTSPTTRQFVKYGIVGAFGALLHLALVWLLTEVAGVWYMASVAASAGLVWVSNFTINKVWTFRER